MNDINDMSRYEPEIVVDDCAETHDAIRSAEKCNALVADEESNQNLANDLRRLHRLAIKLDAPPQLESALRLAFRAHAATQHSAPTAAPRAALTFDDKAKPHAARVAPRHTISGARTNVSTHRASGIAAVICAIAIVAAASLTDVSRRDLLVDSSKRSLTIEEQTTVPTPTADDLANTRSLVSAVREAQGDGAADIMLAPRAVRAKPYNADLYTPRFADRVISTNRSGRRHVAPKLRATEPLDAYASAPAELATEFLPLLEAGSLHAIESGHVVRVRLPRSSLVAMGLPMNQDRAGESITADVLLGEDGVARAIRFVR